MQSSVKNGVDKYNNSVIVFIATLQPIQHREQRKMSERIERTENNAMISTKINIE
jgi:hypothetical protein